MSTKIYGHVGGRQIADVFTNAGSNMLTPESLWKVFGWSSTPK